MKLKKHFFRILLTKVLMHFGYEPEDLRRCEAIHTGRVYDAFGYWILVEELSSDDKENILHYEQEPQQLGVKAPSARCAFCELFHTGIPCPLADDTACNRMKFTIIRRQPPCY